MIDEIFDMIMKEARTRKHPSLFVNVMTVFSELTEKLCQALGQMKVEDIKTIRIKLRRKEE